jgi:hypothetical protein
MPGGGLFAIWILSRCVLLCRWPCQAAVLPPSAACDYSICYSGRVREDEWEIYQTDEVAGWMERLRRDDPAGADHVEAAVDVLSEFGPTLGRPLVDTLTGSKIANLKELRPSQTTIRVLFVFDAWRQRSC